MLEIYSLNITVPSNGDIPFNSTSFAKGCTATHSAPSTTALNKRGVYRVSVEASVTPSVAGDVGIQLLRDGVAVVSAFSTTTGVADETTTLGFETLVRVQQDNTCCCTSSPVILQVLNTAEDEVTYPIIKMTVSKLC